MPDVADERRGAEKSDGGFCEENEEGTAVSASASAAATVSVSVTVPLVCALSGSAVSERQFRRLFEAETVASKLWW